MSIFYIIRLLRKTLKIVGRSLDALHHVERYAPVPSPATSDSEHIAQSWCYDEMDFGDKEEVAKWYDHALKNGQAAVERGDWM